MFFLAALLAALGLLQLAPGARPQLLLARQRGPAPPLVGLALLELIAQGAQVGVLIDHGAQLLLLEQAVLGTRVGGGKHAVGLGQQPIGDRQLRVLPRGGLDDHDPALGEK